MTVINDIEQSNRVKEVCLVRFYKELCHTDSTSFPILKWQEGFGKEYGVIRVQKIRAPGMVVRQESTEDKFHVNMHLFMN
jgi:hypothetical protein